MLPDMPLPGMHAQSSPLQVRGSNAALSAAFNMTSYPTLLAVCNGDPVLAERYSGELKSERIASFLVRSSTQHLSGGCCS